MTDHKCNLIEVDRVSLKGDIVAIVKKCSCGGVAIERVDDLDAIRARESAE